MAEKNIHTPVRLRNYYHIFMEIGLIAALLIFIIAMKANLPTNKTTVDFSNEDEAVSIKHIPKTVQQENPQPPPEPVDQAQAPDYSPIIDNSNLNNLEEFSSTDFPELTPPARHKSTKEEKVFHAVEQEPELIGGLKALQSNVNYPARCRRANVEGRVTLQFVVNKRGEIENIEVLRGIGGGCDEAAIEAVKKHAKFKPGRQRGNAVNVRYSLPIRFRLQ